MRSSKYERHNLAGWRLSSFVLLDVNRQKFKKRNLMEKYEY